MIEDRRRGHANAARRGFAFLFLLGCLALLVAFEMPPPAAASQAASKDAAAALGNLPATFTGNLPCADCPGIEYHLDLFPAGYYFLRMTYLERNTHFDEIGRWSISSGGKKLILRAGATQKTQFAIREQNTLRMLGGDGKEIPTSLNYDLQHTSGFSPIEPRLTMQGTYKYSGGRGIFTECLTGQQWIVAGDKNGAEAQKVYLLAQPTTSEKLLVSLDGRLTAGTNKSNAATDHTLTIERSLRFLPGQTCPAK
jgi:copper homeostasis protein (lipoprotein)